MLKAIITEQWRVDITLKNRPLINNWIKNNIQNKFKSYLVVPGIEYYISNEGRAIKYDIITLVIYIADYSLVNLFPSIYENYNEHFNCDWVPDVTITKVSRIR